MNLAELQVALATGERGGTFTFDPASPAFSDPVWNDVKAFVAASFGAGASAGTLVVSGFSKPASSVAVIYNGAAAALLVQDDADFTQATLTVSAVFWLDAGVPALVVTSTTPPGWTLPASLSGIGDSVLDDVQFTAAALTASSSDGIDPVSGDPVTAGVWLAATVAPTGLFAQVAGLVTAPAFEVSGALTLATGVVPVFTLEAAGDAPTPMAPFPFSINIGVYAASLQRMLRTPGGGTAPYYYTQAGLQGVIFLGSGQGAIRIPVRMPISDQDQGLYTFSVDEVRIPFPSWAAFAPLTGVDDLGALLPPDVPPAGALELRELTVVVDPGEPATPVTSLQLTVALNPGAPWPILPNGILSVAELSASFTVQGFGLRDPGIPSAVLRGVFRFGDTVDYALSLSVPQLVLQGELANNTTIPLSSLIDQFVTRVLGVTWMLPAPSMEVIQLDLYAEPRTQQYAIDAAINFGWSLPLGSVTPTFESLTLSVSYDGALVAASIVGNFTIVTSTSAIFLSAGAETPGDGSWLLTAGSLPGSTINLVEILKALLSPVLDPTSYDLPALAITDLDMALTLAPYQDGTYVQGFAFGARTDGLWTFTIGSIEFGIAASVALAAERDQPPSQTWRWSGDLFGALVISNFSVTARYQFTPDNWALIFQLLYQGRGITATLYQRQLQKPTPHAETLLKIQLGDLSFGEIVDYLVRLARPDSDFELGAPWSLLYQINFKDLSLLVNLTTWAVGIRYEPHLDLGFVALDAIQLDYVTNAAGAGSVTIAIEGTFLGRPYGTDDPLTWDLLDEPAPKVPGQGPALISIEYLALGQRVGVPQAANAASVQEALDAFRAALAPLTSATANPLLQPGNSSLQFQADSSMLFGVELTILGEFIGLGAVLWDPYLYGAYIALGGERAGALAGLRFELLYKKVTDDIGVFKIELRIPEAFRQLELGEVSITLAVVKVDLYTNGNFRVDLGFPRNADFSDSFCVQVFPFIGFGGFYFALLNGQTSTTVPRITNGTFSPVIEAGLGLSLGVGKEIRKGALEAGLSVTVYAILEGTLAFFNPTSAGTTSAMYYRLSGTAGIVGKLYGTVDFYVVKVAVSLVARASITLVIEAYQPIEISLAVEVSVDAEVKVFFVSVSFSFQMKLEQSFVIGSRSTPPWLLAPDPAGAAASPAVRARAALPGAGTTPRAVWTHAERPRLAHQRRAHRMAATRLRRRALPRHPAAQRRARSTSRLQRAAAGAAPVLTWTPAPVFPSVQTVPLALLPAFSLATPSTLYPPMPGDTPQVEGVMLVTAANTIAPGTARAEFARAVSLAHLPQAGDASQAPFNILVEAGLRWAILALLGSGAQSVTLVELAEILQLMATDSTTESVGFSYQNLTAFIAANMVFEISGLPSGSPSTTSGTLFPMIPELAMTAPGVDKVAFNAYNPVDQAYITQLGVYYSQLLVDALADVAHDPLGAVPGPAPAVAGGHANPRRRRLAAGSDTTESLATVVFRDWFLILTRSAVQAALDALENWRYAVQEGDTLDSIAAQFPREPLTYIALPGDTISSIAALFGMTAAALRTLNDLPADQETTTPGEVLLVTAGVTPETIALANQMLAELDPATPLPIDGVVTQAAAGGTLQSIADAFGLGDQVAAIGTSNAPSRDLLAAGATMTVPGFTHAALAGDDLAFLAAFYTARNGAVADGADLAWYVQAVFQLNPSVSFAAPLAAGVALVVPSAYQAQSNGAPATQAYSSRAGDTQDWIAAYFCQVQHRASSLTAFEAAIQAANQGVDFGQLQPGQIVNIPAQIHTVIAGDTLASIAADVTLPGGTGGADSMTAAALAGANAEAAMLAPLAVLILPTVTHTIAATDTLGSIAAFYNLSVSELSAAAAPVADLFLVAAPLTIPSVPAQTVDALVAQVLANNVNEVAASVSRFLAYGLRLPDPTSQAFRASDAAPVTCYGLYDLVGAQFPGPALGTPSSTISFTSSGVGWVSFADTAAAAPGDTLAALERRHPGVTALNPGLDATRLAPGAVFRTARGSDELVITLTAGDLAANYPSTTFTPRFTKRPAALALYNEQPERTSLDQMLHWQAAVSPPFAGPPPANPAPTGEPTLWLFPAPLLVEAARSSSTPYRLATMPRGLGPDAPETGVEQYEWATLVPIRIATLTATDPANPTGYVVQGADHDGRKLLLAAWQWLSAHASTETATQLWLLYPPSGDSQNPAGLASDAIDAGGTYLLKTNLSTETTSDGGLVARAAGDGAPLQGDYYAGLDAPLAFLQLLWECSVVGTGGYVLHYQDAAGGPLPPTVFSQSGDATIYLVILMGSQLSPASPARELYAFNNAAVVGDNVDASAVNVFAEASDGSRLTRVASVTPGNVGFTAVLANPSTGTADPTPEQRTCQLFSLFGFAISTAGTFSASNLGLPAGPARPDAGGDDEWSFKQVFAVSPLAISHPLPVSAALPDPGRDPYAGVAPSSTVTVALEFVDLFGNQAVATPPIAPLEIPVGYTDDVIGLGAWPGLVASYMVSGAGAPSVDLTLALRWSTYIAGTGCDFATAVSAASAHRERYRQVYYQLQQADVTATLTTSLDQAKGAAPNRYPLAKYSVTDAVNGAYAFLSAAAWLAQASYTTADGDTLGGVANAWSSDAASLLGENQQLEAATVFAGAAMVPAYYTVMHGDTLVSIATPLGLTPAALIALGANAQAPIPAGFDLAIPATTATAQTGDTLATIAATARCTVGDLAVANADTTAIFTADIALAAQGVTVLTEATDSFTTLAGKFAALYRTVTPAEIALANARTANLIVATTSLTVDRRLVPAPTSLQALAAELGDSVAHLATINGALANLLIAGTPLYLSQSEVTPVAGETVQAFAVSRNRIDLAELAACNAATALAAGTALRIPLTASFPGSPVPYVPYSALASDTLASIAARFVPGGDAMAIAALDADVAGTIAGGQTITVGADSVQTTDGDSMQSVIARFASEDGATVTLAQLVAAMTAAGTLARETSVWLCPAPTVGTYNTAAAAAARSGISTGDFARVNASLWPLLTPGVAVTLGGVTLTIGSTDTLAKLVTRFALAGVAVTVEDIAAAAGVTLVATARFLIPPRSIAIDQPLRADRAFPAALFAVEVDVTLARSAALVDPDFARVERVQRAGAELAPDAGVQGGALSLAAFAGAFEAAFAGEVKVATSRGASVTGEAVRQIWAVDFGATGISQVALDGAQAAMFAFKPLSRTLESRPGVRIQPYTPGIGLGTAAPLDLQSVDLEVWLREFLAAVDLVLAPAYALPLFSVPALAGDGNPYGYFDGLVADKQTVAEGLARNLVPLLDLPAPQGDRDAAREAVKQKLLVGLSSAYATSAVVQVPAAVTSTLPAAPGARLSGKPVSLTYVTGDTDGFTEPATFYAVSADWVALVFGDAVNLLTQQTVTYAPPDGPVQTHLVAPDETLHSLARAFQATPADLVAYLSWPAGAGLFAPAVELPASGFSVSVPAGATLGSLADYFGIDVASLAIANQAVTGIFAAASITIASVTVDVTTSNNSIAGIAAAFTAAGLAMTPAVLGVELREQPDLLATGVAIAMAELVPDYTMTSSKVTLSSGATAANFLLTTPAARFARSLWLDLDYVVNELEYDIVPVLGVTGYVDSSWLSFVLPIGRAGANPSALHTTIGPVRVPVPLRDYPPPPVLLAQTGKPSVAAPSTVADARLWTYGFSYNYEAAAQDTISLSVTLNEPPSSLPTPAAAGELDLLPSLAQFAAVYPQVQLDLALLLDPELSSNHDALTRAYVAVRTMADLVGRVAAAWRPSLETPVPPAAPAPMVQIFTYDARELTKEVLNEGRQRLRDEYILTTTGASPGPNGAWPEVYWLAEDGARHQLERQANPSPTECVYTYRQSVDARLSIGHVLDFPRLAPTTCQSGRAGLHVSRNRQLLFPASPSTPAPATAAAFVYETPHTAFAERLIPLVVRDEPIAIRSSGDLTTDLTAMFAALLGSPGDGYHLQVAVEYGYQLVKPIGPGAPIDSLLPMVFSPLFPFVSGTGSTATVTTLVAAITAWAEGKTLPATGALYVFAVSLFSSLDPARLRPLLTLGNLQFSLS